MTSARPHRNGPVRGGRLRTALALAAAVLLAAACDSFGDLLDVEAPSRIPAGNLEGPESADLLLDGAVADFECAFGAYTVLGGMVGEEFVDATQTADRWPYDRREVQPNDGRYSTDACQDLGVYTPLSTARWSAESILRKLQGWTDAEVAERTAKSARAATYAGYANLLLGEGFCSGVVLDDALQPGGEVGREVLLQRAVELFTTALGLAQSAGDDGMLNTARVGRARAYLDLGQGAEADADAKLVPADFVMEVSASTVADRTENRVFEQNNQLQEVSIAEPYRSYTHMGVPDPRVQVSFSGDTANDEGRTLIYVQEKYADLASPMPLATGAEARLIMAEVEGGPAAVEIINAFHDAAGLPHFSSTDPEEIRRHVIEERRSVLFLDSHHLGDVIRYDLPLTPGPGTPFVKGGTYGPDGADVCLPLPDVERLNNPNIEG
jgi:hypothetical protein